MNQKDRLHEPKQQKKAFKSLIGNSVTKQDAIKTLTGNTTDDVLLLVVGGTDPCKWFLNGEPISQQKFERLVHEEIKRGALNNVGITVGGKTITVIDADEE